MLSFEGTWLLIFAIIGISQICMIGPMAIGPGLATVLFAESIKSSIPHAGLIWIIMIVLCEHAYELAPVRELTIASSLCKRLAQFDT